jgi:hypothetical protein
MSLDWEGNLKAIETRNAHETRAEQLAGDNAALFAQLHDLHGQKFKDLAECVLLDMRYKLKLEYEKEVILRLGVESLLRAMNACSVEAKKKKEEPKKTNKLKI